ncbi:F0F1 ATP synthase subunit B family protein [Dongia rigui]|uniref:ATP synthase subunit b n=1 Tax=Dongia rigui TaxID=940149 RepID=A0ABU5DWG7_9PROT|nr:F0F1 ATP synthase subunit B' [Dongia rigui]MDY0871327.1 F0F1 ATP synthase subunit B' [Dongia rigui]
MPQFDPAIFSPLLVWLVVTFVALYVLMSKFALPKVATIIDQRSERIEGNLAKAEQLKSDAAAVLAAYEKAIADAKAQAQAELAKAAAEIAAETARREADFAKRLGEQTRAAEGRIKSAQADAMAQVRAIASDLAAGIATKLTGASVDQASAGAAVEAAIKER